jgi:hypothetical protein
MTLPSLNSKFKELLFNHEKLKSILKVFSYISKGFPYFKYRNTFHYISINEFEADTDPRNLDWGTLDVGSSILSFSGEISISGTMELTQFSMEYLCEYADFTNSHINQENRPIQHTIEPLNEDENKRIVIHHEDSEE